MLMLDSSISSRDIEIAPRFRSRDIYYRWLIDGVVTSLAPNNVDCVDLSIHCKMYFLQILMSTVYEYHNLIKVVPETTNFVQSNSQDYENVQKLPEC
jgi:hypothetical protein